MSRQQIIRAQARTIMERKCPVLMDQHEARVRPSLQTYFRSSIRVFEGLPLRTCATRFSATQQLPKGSLEIVLPK